jgi:hypothetical protein
MTNTKWPEVEEMAAAFLEEVHASQTTSRKEVLFALAKARYRLNRDPQLVLESLDVRSSLTLRPEISYSSLQLPLLCQLQALLYCGGYIAFSSLHI